MTKQESFKRRIRQRMELTGERYMAARHALLQTPGPGPRQWVHQPECDDDKLRAATGKPWDEWCDLIDRWPGHSEGHSAVAAWMHDHHGIDHWWAQMITVGWERITGRRAPHQRSDGSYSVGKTRTVAIDGTALRELLLDDAARADLLGGADSELRSKPTTKVLRVRMAEGVALFTITARDDGRSTVNVTHEPLPDPEAADRWRHFWSEWLEALDEVARSG